MNHLFEVRHTFTNRQPAISMFYVVDFIVEKLNLIMLVRLIGFRTRNGVFVSKVQVRERLLVKLYQVRDVNIRSWYDFSQLLFFPKRRSFVRVIVRILSQFSIKFCYKTLF